MENIMRFFTEIMARHVSAGDHVLAGVSGGADSMAMLSLLEEQAEKLGISFSVCHVHHHLRTASDEEWHFVQRYCAVHHIPFYGRHIDVRAHQTSAGMHNTEATAHTLRYAALESAAHDCRAKWILLAHHADDRAETVLMNILRGAAVSGLDVMPEARGIYLRPMLGVTRKEIEAWCREQGLLYVIDDSNNDTRMTRNRLRHELMPVLRTYNLELVRALNRLADTASLDLDYIDRGRQALTEECLFLWTESWGLYAAGPVRNAHDAVKARFIQIETERFSAGRGRLRKEMIDHCLGLLQKGNGHYDMGGNIIFECTSGWMFIGHVPEDQWVHESAVWVHDGLKACINDYSNMIEVRCVQPGDRMPIKGIGRKAVKKIFQEAGWPPALRCRWPLICSKENNHEIIWIPLLAHGFTLMYDSKERILRNDVSIDIADRRFFPQDSADRRVYE